MPQARSCSVGCVSTASGNVQVVFLLALRSKVGGMLQRGRSAECTSIKFATWVTWVRGQDVRGLFHFASGEGCCGAAGGIQEEHEAQ